VGAARSRPDLMKFLFLRILLPLILFLILRSVIRGLFSSSPAAAPAKRSPDPPPVPSAGGELRKDPVCGTYVSTATSLQQKVGGEVVYFCSDQCRVKFRG
jgi:YHS domain-containing protein